MTDETPPLTGGPPAGRYGRPTEPDRAGGQGRPRTRVVLVEPKYAGNVGAVARVAGNFGADDLVIVRGPELTDEANMMAVHAKAQLLDAKWVDTFEDAVTGTDLVVGFTAAAATKPEDHLRQAVSLPYAADRVHAVDGLTALVFGREDYGLFGEELATCDLACQIPVDPSYTSMNLSHAVAVALYEICTRHRFVPHAPRAASHEELERALDTLAHLLVTVRVPAHKVRPTVLAMRRLLGRARVSTWDYHRFMGILSESLKALDAWPVPPRASGWKDHVDRHAAPPADGTAADATD